LTQNKRYATLRLRQLSNLNFFSLKEYHNILSFKLLFTVNMIELKEAHKKFVEHLTEKDRSQATILAYGKDIEQLIEFLENLSKTRTTRKRKLYH